MGRAKGKGKKQNTISTQEDVGSGEEEKALAAHRRRGRPIKPTEDNPEGEEPKDIAAGVISSNDLKSQAAAENGKKRKRAGIVKGNTESVNEESRSVAKPNIEKAAMNIGFRQNGSRRKNKPRRAAEAMVECM